MYAPLSSPHNLFQSVFFSTQVLTVRQPLACPTMANLHAAGMKSLAEFLGRPDANSCRVHEAFDAVKDRKIFQSTKVEKVLINEYFPPDQSRIIDLNIRELGTKPVSHVIDVIQEWHGELNIEQVIAALKSNTYNALPEPFSEKSEVAFAYTMNVNIGMSEN